MTPAETGEDPSATTTRLRGLGTFPRVQVLLGEFITNRQLIPSHSQNHPKLDELPDALKSSLLRAERQGSAWCAWSLQHELFGLTGRIDEVGSRMHAKPVLLVNLYDGKGRVIASSKWLEIQPNQWTFCDS